MVIPFRGYGTDGRLRKEQGMERRWPPEEPETPPESASLRAERSAHELPVGDVMSFASLLNEGLETYTKPQLNRLTDEICF